MTDTFSDLKGKTLIEITANRGDDTIVLKTSDGAKYLMHYEPDCCAVCTIEDICGDLNDLIGEPLLMAEEATNREHPPGITPPPDRDDSFTWTFYKLATVKGGVTIRWYGSSNGCYSESVMFEKLLTDKELEDAAKCL